MAMSNLNMRIITEATAFGMTITWIDEKEYQLGKEFLADLGARGRQTTDVAGDTPECFYLETEQQYLALLDFRRSLRKKRES
jgi:hypothetical protein